MMRSRAVMSVLGLLMAGSMAVFCGCEGKGDDVQAVAGTGRLTVRGNVLSFGTERVPAAVAGVDL